MHNHLVRGIFNKEAGFHVEAVKNVMVMELPAVLSECDTFVQKLAAGVCGQLLNRSSETGSVARAPCSC